MDTRENGWRICWALRALRSRRLNLQPDSPPGFLLTDANPVEFRVLARDPTVESHALPGRPSALKQGLCCRPISPKSMRQHSFVKAALWSTLYMNFTC